MGSCALPLSFVFVRSHPSMVVLSEAILRKAGGNFDLESNATLKLDNLDIDAVGACLAECPNLTKLDLSHNKLKEAVGFGDCAQLQTLDLSANFIPHLIGVELPQSLECLKMAGNTIKEPSDLPSLTSLPKLSSLYLQTAEEDMANPICLTPEYPESVIKILPHLENLDGQRLRVMRGRARVETPPDAKVELPPSVPWLCGFDWEPEVAVEDNTKPIRRFDRLAKDCAAKNAEAQQLLAL